MDNPEHGHSEHSAAWPTDTPSFKLDGRAAARRTVDQETSERFKTVVGMSADMGLLTMTVDPPFGKVVSQACRHVAAGARTPSGYFASNNMMAVRQRGPDVGMDGVVTAAYC